MCHFRNTSACTFACVPVQVLKFIEEYSNLKSMGFALEVITGAMIAYPNDIAEATEACISGST